MLNVNLIDKILNKDNLNNAFKKVKNNKGAAGIDGMVLEPEGNNQPKTSRNNQS